MGKTNDQSSEQITDVEIPNDPVESSAASDSAGEGDRRNAGRPSLAELADAGFAPGEIEMAKKQGIIEGGKDGGNTGDSGGDSADKGGSAKTDDGQTKGGLNVKDKEKEKPKTVDERFRILAKGKSPEQILADVSEKGSLTPEQESALLAGLSQNGQALYWTQKKERLKRQKLEADLASERSTKDKRIADLQAQIDTITKARVKAPDDLGLDDPEPEEIDPKKKPVTLEDLEKLEVEKADKAKSEAQKHQARVTEIKSALDDQHAEAQTRYENFDEALGFTNEILDAANKGTLDKLYPDPRERSRITRKAVELLRAFANADSFEPGDFNAADMSFDLAKEHPQFGKPSKVTPVKKTDETGADGDPEKAARIVANASRRGSSAAISGGGSRRVPLEELTADQAVRIPTKNFNKLPAATREKLLGKR